MISHVLEALTDYAFAFNQDEGKYFFVSKHIKELTGYCQSDFLADVNLWRQLADPRDAGVISHALNTAGEDPQSITYRIITAAGQPKWVKEKYIVFIDELSGNKFSLSIIKDAQREEDARYNKEEAMAGYSILFDNNPGPMWIYEVSTLRILKINTAAIKTYGYTEAEFLTMDIRDLRPKEDILAFDRYIDEKGIKDSRHKGFIRSGVWKHRTKAGDILYVDITGDNITYKNYDCRIVVGTDITERIHSQEEIQLREQFLNSLIDSQTNFLVRIDINGLYTYANKQFLDTFGYTNDQIIGKHFRKITIPEEVELCETAFKNCIANKGKAVNLVHKKINKAGDLYDTEWEFIAITGENGQVTGIQGVGQDVTERKNSQKEIAEAKKNLEALFNNTEDLIWSVNCQCNYLYMNQAYKNTILSHSGIAPKKGDTALHDIYSEQLLDEWRAYYRRGFNGEAYIITNESVDHNTQQLVCFEISFNPIYNYDGEVTGVGCFARNITDRIKINKAIYDQNERLRNIASLSSHNLRRPVATMLGLINIIDKENFHNPENKEIIEHLLVVGSEIDDVIRLIVDNSHTFTSTANYPT